jgi:D-alanine-D-alanine ligase
MNYKIGVIIGGPSPEHDISILTGLQSARLLSAKNDVSIIYWTKDNKWFLLDSNLESTDFVDNPKIFTKELHITLGKVNCFSHKRKKLDIDIFLNSCHGGPGEDGTLQGLLELMDVRYTGPNLTTAQLCMDKYAFYSLMKTNNLPVLDKFRILKDKSPDFTGPYVLKPQFGGSSIGVEVVKDYETALKLIESSDLYSKGALLERYLQNADDLLIGVRNYPELNYSEIEKPIRNSNLFSYEDKYLNNGGLEGSKRELPVALSEDINQKIFSYVKEINKIIPSRGIVRYDFLKIENKVYINEINTIPGSHALYLWKNLNVSKYELLNDVVQEGLNDKTNQWSTQGSDGLALKSAKDIQSKLG